MKKVLFPLIAVLMAALMAASCGGGGGGSTNGGILGGLQPIPGATVVPSTTIDTAFVLAMIDPGTGNLRVIGQAGAAAPVSEVRIANNTGDFVITSYADGSFDTNGFMPPGFSSASGEAIRLYQTTPSFAVSDPVVVTVQ